MAFSVIFVAEAAYTGEKLGRLEHVNIAGDYVSGGVNCCKFKNEHVAAENVFKLICFKVLKIVFFLCGKCDIVFVYN